MAGSLEQTLASIPGAGTAAAFLTGAQIPSQNAQQDADLQYRLSQVQQNQIANNQAQQMNPLLLTQQDLNNQKLGYELPGVQADSSLKQTKAYSANATRDSDIATTLAGNRAAIAKADYQENYDIGQKMGNIGASLATGGLQFPGTAFNLKQMLSDNGLDPNNPKVAQFLTGLPSDPAAAGQLLRARAENMTRMSATYLEKIDPATIHADSAIGVAKIDAGSRENVANINANARMLSTRDRYDADNLIANSKNFQELASRAYAAYSTAAQKGDTINAQRYMGVYQEAQAGMAKTANMNAAAAASYRPDLTQYGIKLNGPVGGGNPAPTNPAPPVAPNPAQPPAPPVVNPAGEAQRPPPNVSTVDDVRKMSPAYANLSDDKIRQAYKQKYKVDLK